MSGMEPLLMIAATGMQAVGAIQQGKAAQAAAEYNAKIAQDEANREADRLRREQQRVFGQTRAGVAKSGVTMEGTPLSVISESAALSELDILNTLWSGQSRASMYQAEGSNAMKSAYIGAAANLLSGGSKVAGMM